MAETSNVIYLPPGVVAPPLPMQHSNGAPFDRAFFQQVLPQAVSAFCQQASCESPVVEVLTTDGTTLYVIGISGFTEAWVALHISEPDHDHPVQVFIPYQTVFRVEIHPASDIHEGRLGFVTAPVPAPSAPVETPPVPAAPIEALAERGKPSKKKKK
jgi:hypothetical protein